MEHILFEMDLDLDSKIVEYPDMMHKTRIAWFYLSLSENQSLGQYYIYRKGFIHVDMAKVLQEHYD